jgi:uncharacterized protein
MAKELPFDPFPLFPGSHQQTIIGSFYLIPRRVSSKTREITLKEGDKVTIEITRAKDWKETDRTVFMVHGLCGSHQSPYMIRLAKKLSERGYRVIRFNLRGCGSGRGKAKKIYHSGRSDDVLEVIKILKKETPQSKISLVGFSLGGNIVLKLCGQLNTAASMFLDQVIAIGPPVDLFSSVCLLQEKENQFYQNYFLKLLKNDVEHRQKIFPDIEKFTFPKKITLLEFDEIYTAPQSGFANAMDYYKKSSSRDLIPEIDISCQILFSEDDPLISSTSLDHFSFKEHIQVYKTKKGGHLGFLSIPGGEKGFHWMDTMVIDWIEDNKNGLG